ncbi:MAG: 4Fe-4S dicluster domain-containing protein, partial [Bdellovibrio sp.]
MDKVLDWLSLHLSAIGLLLMFGICWWGIRKRKKDQKRGEELYQKTLKSGMTEPATLHPEINPALCAGCGSCTVVCPEGEVLKLIGHKAVLVNPTKCVGHGECEAACPFGAIDLVFGTKKRGVDIPRLTADFETNVPGLYIAGELGGMGLIRNAVKQGQQAARHAIKNLKKKNKTDTDLFIVGAGPAGLAACLAAIENKSSYICIDQNTLGGTVNNFPRQKVVMSHPADLPIVGKMKFRKNKVSKEELLAYWDSVRKKAGVKIQSEEKFEGLSGEDGFFKVKTSKGEYTAKKVILCMGVRGSPRKLGLENEDLPKVAYNLIDPEQYQNKHVAVVGGGNAGVEAAQYLAKPKYKNKVTLLVRGEAFDRCNEENQNIIFDMEKKGLVTIRFNTVVKEIHEKH